MGTFSIWHWLIVLIVVMLLFGAGKIPRLMRDMGQGINAFKKGLKESDTEKEPAESEKEAIEQNTVAASATTEEQDAKAAKS